MFGPPEYYSQLIVFELSKVAMLCSCLISRNLLSGLKTCIEVSSYMYDDEAGMPRGAVGMPTSFSEDKKKLDADFMVCVILLPFLFILSDNKVGEELKIPTQPNPSLVSQSIGIGK